jgi:hypothetical protein
MGTCIKEIHAKHKERPMENSFVAPGDPHLPRAGTSRGARVCNRGNLLPDGYHLLADSKSSERCALDTATHCAEDICEMMAERSKGAIPLRKVIALMRADRSRFGFSQVDLGTLKQWRSL